MGEDMLVNSDNMWWLNKQPLKEWKEFLKFWKCGNFLETLEVQEHFRTFGSMGITFGNLEMQVHPQKLWKITW